ncbi:hypothetical protein HYPSUDRAFT_32040 [Hypholoma sublateritium FD-334 SS-4]|uniref:Uncharacterized protein n=1 Tax=Hypholoma sublateritium (strain FD-334 SS-4) TaxID=945553 RepID=A0A0D2N0S1_HYPSF|nr:hypothetical protein HYPSUDRAFT_32040 [Hypholoma sublateritium FD-334 SS-4]
MTSPHRPLRSLLPPTTSPSTLIRSAPLLSAALVFFSTCCCVSACAKSTLSSEVCAHHNCETIVSRNFPQPPT